MAEIKSTLDLVMERTRHLTLSEKEKASQNAVQTQKRVSGLVKRYLNQLIKPQEFMDELAQLNATYPESRARAVSELIDNVDLSGDNNALLALLRDYLDTPVDEIQSITADCRKKLEAAAGEQRAKTIERLRTERGISGSALMANLATDNSWQQERRRLEASFREKLDALKPQ